MYIIANYLQFSVCVIFILKHRLPVFMVSFNRMFLQKLEYMFLLGIL